MKTHFKFILCFVGILSITACGSSDPDLPGSGGTGGDDETLVTLAGDRSFSLLSLSAGKGLASGTYNIQPLAAFIQENNTDVVALQDVDFGTARTGKKNLVGEVAYRCSKDGQPAGDIRLYRSGRWRRNRSGFVCPGMFLWYE